MKVKLFEKNSKSKRIVAAKSRKLKIMNKKKKKKKEEETECLLERKIYFSHLI